MHNKFQADRTRGES